MLSVVVDLGGTNIRLTVCDLESGELSQLKEFPCEQFSSLEEALEHYFATLSEKVSHLCIGIASAVEGDQIEMTNLHWAFSIKAMKEKLQLDSLYVINDYTAISLAVPFLGEKDKVKIGGGAPVTDRATAVFGPGTGLGVSHIIKAGGKWLSLDGEGGHTSFTAHTREQADILFLLQEEFGHVSAERILSGQGLVNIYKSLCKLSSLEPKFTEPKDVSLAALSGNCPVAARTLEVFCQVMGSFAGNLALNLDCRGGVYIAGGIVPRFVDFFQESEFRKFFEDKGRFQEYLAEVPTYLIINDNPGLLGAAVYLRQEQGTI